MPRRPVPPKPPMSLSCSTCGQEVRTRVTPDPAGWPTHRCRSGVIRPFDTGAPLTQSLLGSIVSDRLADALLPAGTGLRCA